jgi:hypothetical protein
VLLCQELSSHSAPAGLNGAGACRRRRLDLLRGNTPDHPGIRVSSCNRRSSFALQASLLPSGIGSSIVPGNSRALEPNTSPALKARSGRSLHLTLLAGKHRSKDRSLRNALHLQLRRQLNPAPDLDLDLDLHRPLHDEMLAKLLAALHQKTLVSLLRSMLDSIHRPLQASMLPASHGCKLRGRHRRGFSGKTG